MKLLDLVRLEAGDRVLDVGTGGGALAIAAARIAGPENVTAIDTHPAMIEIARASATAAGLQGITFAEAAAPSAQKAFDVVVSQFCPSFLAPSTLARCREAMRPGGRAGALLLGSFGAGGLLEETCPPGRELGAIDEDRMRAHLRLGRFNHVEAFTFGASVEAGADEILDLVESATGWPRSDIRAPGSARAFGVEIVIGVGDVADERSILDRSVEQALLDRHRSTLVEVDAGSVPREIEAGAILIDVREPSELSTGSMPGAINIPRGKLEHAIWDLSAADRTVLLVSGDGRASLAAISLAALGFRRVRPVSGWQADKKPWWKIW